MTIVVGFSRSGLPDLLRLLGVVPPRPRRAGGVFRPRRGPREHVPIGDVFLRAEPHRDHVAAGAQHPVERAGGDVELRPRIGLRDLADQRVDSRIGDAGDVARAGRRGGLRRDRKSTRLNSSHTVISYAVFCLKKKKNKKSNKTYHKKKKKKKKNKKKKKKK